MSHFTGASLPNQTYRYWHEKMLRNCMLRQFVLPIWNAANLKLALEENLSESVLVNLRSFSSSAEAKFLLFTVYEWIFCPPIPYFCKKDLGCIKFLTSTFSVLRLCYIFRSLWHFILFKLFSAAFQDCSIVKMQISKYRQHTSL